MRKDKVLLIGYANKYYRTEYVKHIDDGRKMFEILTFEKCNEDNRKLYGNVFECLKQTDRKIGTILTYIKFLIILLRMPHYKCIHIHSVKKIESIFSTLLKLKCDILVSSIYGSDLYRISNKEREKIKPLFKKSTYIQVETKAVERDLNKFYNNNFSDKIKIVSFGISVLDNIKKMKSEKEKIKSELGIPEKCKVITIGYNATKEQHHLEILEQFAALKEQINDSCYFIIPMSYGNDTYKNIVVDKFQQCQLTGQCFCQYTPLKEVAKLRIASDIMIQVQDTDTFSSSMIEYLYAGNIIITGAWLPYDELSDYIVTIDSVSSVGKKVIDVLNNMDKYKEMVQLKAAGEYISAKCSWEMVRNNWLALYQ